MRSIIIYVFCILCIFISYLTAIENKNMVGFSKNFVMSPKTIITNADITFRDNINDSYSIKYSRNFYDIYMGVSFTTPQKGSIEWDMYFNNKHSYSGEDNRKYFSDVNLNINYTSGYTTELTLQYLFLTYDKISFFIGASAGYKKNFFTIKETYDYAREPNRTEISQDYFIANDTIPEDIDYIKCEGDIIYNESMNERIVGIGKATCYKALISEGKEIYKTTKINKFSEVAIPLSLQFNILYQMIYNVYLGAGVTFFTLEKFTIDSQLNTMRFNTDITSSSSTLQAFIYYKF